MSDKAAFAPTIPDSMQAAILYGPHDLRLESRAVPIPESDDVLVAIRSVGICGSDVHYWDTGKIGVFQVKAPFILGHECAGVVVALGENVKSFSVGDRVALEPGVPCRVCPACKEGRYNLCPNVVFMATPPVDGSFVEYVSHPADFAYRLPDHVSLEEGALLEPLSVGMHAVARSGLTLGARVLVTGAGPIGLTALLAARAAGASEVYITDPVAGRLDIARKLGATESVPTGVDLVERIKELTQGEMVDVVIECSGASVAQREGLLCLKRGGVIVLVGLGGGEVTLPAGPISSREVDVRGVFRYANTYPKAVRLVSSGQIDLKPLITHHFGLSEVARAMEIAHSRSEGAIKVVVHPTVG